MKLHFEPNLDYQLQAIESVCDLFRGQEICRTEFTVTQDGADTPPATNSTPPCASIFKISRTTPARLRPKIWTIVQKNCPTSLGAAWRVQKKCGAGFSPRPRINWLRAVARLKT
jgi:hypothetical protein